MKIGLIGFGKMGQALALIAQKKGHEVVACLTSQNINYQELEKADVCIDFTAPDAVAKTISALAPLKKNIVIGTTGWDDFLPEAQKRANEVPFGLLTGANFSIGMALLKKIIKENASLFHTFGYDVAGIEMHHTQKKDAPSGSARELLSILLDTYENPITFSSLRLGNLFGIHEVIFNSKHDMMTLKHEALSRECFAEGALAAAQWLLGKTGAFTFEDFIEDLHANQRCHHIPYHTV